MVPDLAEPITALSLAVLRRRIEERLLPDSVEVRLVLDRAARQERDQRRRWGREVAGTPGLKVGLAWAGNPTHKNDRNRSICLEQLRPLLDLPGVSWFSLQISERSGDIARFRPARSPTCLHGWRTLLRPRRLSHISILW